MDKPVSFSHQYPPRALAWGKKVSAEFRSILYQGCINLGWGADAASALMACIAFETAESFNPAIKNPRSSATGLIQFMADTAKSLGTSTEQLAAMSAEEQLRWVFKYFDQFSKLKNNTPTYADIYMAILLPSAIGKSMNSVIMTRRQYAVNSGLDLNKDGFITKAEAAENVFKKLRRGFLDQFVFLEPPTPNKASEQ